MNELEKENLEFDRKKSVVYNSVVCDLDSLLRSFSKLEEFTSGWNEEIHYLKKLRVKILRAELNADCKYFSQVFHVDINDPSYSE